MTTVVEEEKQPRLLYRDMRTRSEEIVDELIKERVLAGIAWLDENVGPHWPDLVDPSTLVMSRGNACVLGKVFKAEAREDPSCRDGYEIGLNHAVPETGSHNYSSAKTRFGKEHGFYHDTLHYDYDELDEAWKLVLA